MIVLAVLTAFLVGSLPLSRLVERRWSADLKQSGSGNAGAGNATRTIGLSAGASLAFLDGMKGLVPVVLARRAGFADMEVVSVALAALAGNNWPVWRSDRGGRGLATSVGILVGFASPVLLWPAVWSFVGWKIGGGVAGFIGWGLLPAYVVWTDTTTMALAVLAAGLAACMVVRRAQGNSGFELTDMVRRVVFDRDPRPASAPKRPLLIATRRGIWIPALLVVGFPTYLWVTGTRASDLTVGRWTLVLLAGAAATELLAKFTFGELFREGALRSGIPLSRWAAFRAALVGTGVARLIPVGGAVTPLAMAWSVGDETEGTIGAAVRATVLSYGGLSVAAGAGLVWVALVHAPAYGVRTALLTGLALSVLGLALIGAAGRLRRLTFVIPRKYRGRVEASLVDHGLRPRSWILLSSRVMLEAATLGMTLTAFGIVMRPSQVIAAFGVSQIVGGLPGSPGGLGVTEMGLLGVLALFGIPAAAAAAPVLTFRVISYWLPALGGVAVGGHAYLRRRAAV